MSLPSTSSVARLVRLAGACLFVVAAASCGSDDESSSETVGTDASTSSADLDENHQLVFDRTVELAEANGFDFEEGCLRDIVSQLSDEDAALIVAADPSDDPELSEQGEALGDSIESCAVASTNSSLVDAAADKAIAYEDDLDPDCVRESFAKLSDDQLQLWLDSETDSTDPKLIAVGFSILDCIGFDDPLPTTSG